MMNVPDARSAAPRHAFESLTPDVVLDALASVGLFGDGRLTALSSYENRVYQVHLEQGLDRDAAAPGSVVVKFYRPARWTDVQIREEHSFSFELMAAEIPVVGPLMLQGSTSDQPQSLHHHAGFAFSVSPQRGGRPPELDDFEVLEWVGRFLARIHTVGAARPFVHRPALDVQSFAQEPMEWLLSHHMVPLDVQGAWQKSCKLAIDLIASNAYFSPASVNNKVEKINENDSTQAVATIRLHGDCHPGNILWTPTDAPHGGPHFVDLDDARSGPAVQDLWMLLSGDRRQRSTQLSALIDGYEQFRPFDRRELALIEPLRTLRLIHYSAWLARRWQDPTFPINFPWFGSSDYWTSQVHMLEEQIEAMAEEPLMV
ncbi:MAG: serine/threonine protein kinase [Burkholderiaceae bacterium]|nr:serine/threonine protein kinase [Burkholderiaceae bacterium]